MHDPMFLWDLDDSEKNILTALLLMSTWIPPKSKMVLLYLCANYLLVWPQTQVIYLGSVTELWPRARPYNQIESICWCVYGQMLSSGGQWELHDAWI